MPEYFNELPVGGDIGLSCILDDGKFYVMLHFNGMQYDVTEALADDPVIADRRRLLEFNAEANERKVTS